MSDARAFSDHVNKLMFIKRLQEREGLLDKYMNGNGLLPDGGGLMKGLGLPSGGGLDSSGFKSRRPAVQAQMLSGLKEQVESTREEMVKLTDPNNFTDEHGNAPPYGDLDEIIVPKDNIIKLLGTTRQAQFRVGEVAQIINEKGDFVNDNKDSVSHDAGQFTGTTSKAVIFKHPDGRTAKFKSIAELSKHTGYSKYKLLGKFKPKKSGDSFYHKELGGTLEFVDKKQYNAHAAVSSFTEP